MKAPMGATEESMKSIVVSYEGWTVTVDGQPVDAALTKAEAEKLAKKIGRETDSRHQIVIKGRPRG